jgi:transposase
MTTIEITRRDLTAAQLRAASGKAPNARSARRMLAIAQMLEGADRKTAAETCGMDRQTLRDWVHRYNSEGLEGLENRKSSGPRRLLSVEQKAKLSVLVEKGPDPEKDGVVRWRRVDLKRRITELFGIEMHERTVGKQLKALGFVRLSVRPQHPKADHKRRKSLKKFSQTVAAVIPEHARGKPIEIWFQDEARVGQQGTLTRVWAKRGTRPRAPRDQHYEWTYIFGAACPARGVTAALVLPKADTEAFSLHVAEIAKEVAPGAHAILLADGAGYHVAAGLKMPDNVTLLRLPPYSPELNPMENVWEYLRQNKLAITVFNDYDHILDKSCKAWNFFATDKEAITSITTRNWANVSL